MSSSRSLSAALFAIFLAWSSQSVCWAFQTSGGSAAASAPSTTNHRLAAPWYRISAWQTSMPSRTACTLHMSSNDDEDPKPSSSSTNVKLFELDDAFEDDGENVVGTKFFGGNTVKEELYVPEEEERALELQNVKEEDELEYRRFEDEEAFDEVGRRVGGALQGAINKILYDEANEGGFATWKEDPSLQWDTPFSKSSGASSPLAELAASKSFYNKLDVAILSAKAAKSEGNVNVVEVRWDIGAVWPNFWESRVILTGTSTLAIRDDGESITVLKQVDRLDGSNPNDVVGTLSSQLPPRFWDMYHIGMTPSAELDPRFGAPLSSSQLSKTNQGNKGLLSSYKLSYLPPRLVTEPSLVDTNGRDGRTAQALPNHGFSTAIKTMGPNKEVFTPVSPVEVSISKAEGTEGGSLIKWSVPVPPEFASKHVLPLPVMGDEEDDDDEEDSDANALAEKASPYTAGRTNRPPPNPPQSLSCSYSLRPSRLVATLPYAGSPQDEEVTQLRRQLYSEAVERDGYKPKLDPKTGRPIFFFWMNDAKACFTRKGGLGMAVYEWRADWSKSNEVGIELECC